LRVLLMAAKRMDGVGGSLRACSANATVLEVMRITGFDSIIPVRDSSEAALQELSG
jgi:anti-anti-sigma factor